MGRTLRYVGLLILAVSACLIVAETAGWVPAGMLDTWVWAGIRIGAVSVGIGLLLAILSPVGRELRRGRCVRCGAATQRGQTYCNDHLQEAVNEYRDQTRNGIR